MRTGSRVPSQADAVTVFRKRKSAGSVPLLESSSKRPKKCGDLFSRGVPFVMLQFALTMSPSQEPIVAAK